ncbi:MAG: DNA topoisomerase [Nitrosopumilaceae archaeon]
MVQKVILKSSSQSIQTLKITKSRHVIKPTKKRTEVFKNEIIQYFDSNGYLSWSARKKKYIILGTNKPINGLVECPECHLGQLMVIRSNKTRKRFIGCSNYYNGCKASSPLLQKAKLRATKMACKKCSWPLIIFRYSRKQKWTRQCSNFSCRARP